jgi:class 3 adenylate cyclase/predicted ATPase
LQTSSVRCPACQEQVHAGAQACHACGHALSADAPTSRDGPERRLLTVLFADIVGSTRLMKRLGDEAWLEVLNEYHKKCGEVVRRWDGHSAQLLGDGSLAYFGYPEAHDDDARRAIAAALEIVEVVPRALSIDVRAGIDTGWTIVGGIGSDQRRETLAIGEAVNEASRLQKLALPNCVVISGSTRRLTHGFYDCEPVSAAIPDSAETYQVVRATGAARSIDVARAAGLTPFIGREREIAELRSAWAKAEAGTVPVILVEGEAGIGKSRLVQVLKEHVVAGGGQVVEWLCSSYAKGTPLRPIVEALARSLQIADDEPAAERLQKLERGVASLLPNPAEVVALLAPALSIPLDATDASLGTTPQTLRRRLLETLLDLLHASSEQRPLLLAVEDLHWADPSTIELIGLALERVRQARVMILLTSRPEEFRWPWSGVLAANRLVLSRLSPPESERMISEVARRRALPSELVEEVAARSDGIPLFVEELTRAVLESEVIEEHADRYDLVGPLEARHVPNTIQGSLSARLDRLADSKRIAVVASALGRSFSYEMIRAVVDSSDADLEKHLRRLVEADLLHVEGKLPDAHWTFRHALIREAAGASLLTKESRALHARIARVLLERFPEAASSAPEVVAEHFKRGALPAPAVDHYRLAGERALAKAANREAIEHLRAAIGLLPLLPEPERPRSELDLQLLLFPALAAIKGWGSSDVDTACHRARELCESLGDRENLLPALWGVWTVHFLRGNLNPAVVVAGQVLDMALSSKDPLLLVLGHHAMGFTRFFRGELSEATRHAEAGIALFDLAQERFIVERFQFSSTLALRVFRAASLWLLGHPKEAERELAEAEAFTRSLGHAPSTAFFLSFANYFGLYSSDYPRVLRAATEMLRLSEEQGFKLWTAVAKVYRGWARAGLDEPEGGLEEMRLGLELFRKTDSALTLVHILVGLAQTLQRAGLPDEALQALREGRAYAETHAEHLLEPELHRLEAEILIAARRGEEKAAEIALRRAIELARSQRAAALEQRAADTLMRLFRAQGREADMVALASQVTPSGEIMRSRS